MKRVFKIFAFVVLCAGLLAGCSSPAVEPEPAAVTQSRESASANAEMIKMQQEIVKLRQRIFDDTQIKMENAQASLMDKANARAKLADAQIKLAEFLGRDDMVVQELQSLVQFYVKTRGQFLEQLESGPGKAKDLYEIEIALMETNIRLSQAVLKIAPSGALRI